MASVEDNARSAIENLIKELEKERSVSSKYATLNEELISKLSGNEEEKAGLIKDNERLLKENEKLKEQIQEMKLRSHQETTESPKDAAIAATDIAADTGVGATIESSKDDSESDEEKIGDITLALATKDTKPIDSIPMDERKRFFVKIMMIIRLTFRGYFGLSFANRWGHFVDRYMCKQIHHYADWLEYTAGDHALQGNDNSFVAAMSSDGHFVFIGYDDNTIIKWNMLTLAKMNQWMAHDQSVVSLTFGHGLLISGSNDKKINVWHGYSNDIIHTLEGHTSAVRSIEFNHNGNEIISGSKDKTMRVWNVKSGECLREIKVHSGEVPSAYFMDDVILSGSKDKCIKITNAADGKEIRKITEGVNDTLYKLYINSDESMIACLFDGGFTIYTWPEMNIIRTIVVRTIRGCFHPINPDILAINHLDSNEIEIYNVKTGDRIHVLKGHTHKTWAMCFSPDGTRIASTSDATVARVWDLSKLPIV